MSEDEHRREVLERLLNLYVDLVNSGECGFWDPEAVPVIKEARVILAEKS